MIYFIDIINKKSFTLYSYSQKQNLTIDFSNISLYLGISDIMGNIITIDENFLSIHLNQVIYKNVNENRNVTLILISEPIELESCDVNINSYDEEMKNQMKKNFFILIYQILSVQKKDKIYQLKENLVN